MLHQLRVFLLCGIALLGTGFGAGTAALAAVHEVMPPNQTSSSGAAWQSLNALFKAGVVKGGDEILLRPGAYGDIKIVGAKFDRPVIIRPARKGTAQLSALVIAKSRNLVFDGLQVWPAAPGKGHLIRAEGTTKGIIFRNMDIRGRQDATSYRGWRKQDWAKWRRAGILVRGNGNAVLSSRFLGLGTAVGVLGTNARIEGNHISGFSHDGIRIAGDNAKVRGNLIEDCIKIDGSHDDGIQSWSLGPNGRSGKGVRKNLIIENNVIREWRGRNAPSWVCALQGIGLFDGMYDSLTIRNNLVVVSAYHGITVSGAVNAEVVNNTVMHRTRTGEKRPWIMLGNHKDGRPPRRVIVANNVAPRISVSKDGINMRVSRNLTERYPAGRLEAPYDGKFMPKAGSDMIGAADPAYAPKYDITGRVRRDANGPDQGAFERP